jgi:hypothetical protein
VSHTVEIILQLLGAVMNEIKEKKSVDTDHYHQLVSQALVNISDPIISKLEKKRKVSELVSGQPTYPLHNHHCISPTPVSANVIYYLDLS